jgi:hypothetical protein
MPLYTNNGSGWFVVVTTAATAPAGMSVLSASFGDVDNDGDVDVLMGSMASLSVVGTNNGVGRINVTVTSIGTVAVAQPVFVDGDGDGDGDGDVDVPSAAFANGVVPPGVIGAGVATVTVLSRAGRRVCHGVAVTVRRSVDGAIVASRLVSSGAASYDVHVSSASLSDSVDIEVSFPSGRRHNRWIQASLSGLRLSTAASPSIPRVVVRDTPAIVSVRVAGVFGPGTVFAVAAPDVCVFCVYGRVWCQRRVRAVVHCRHDARRRHARRRCV